MDKDCPDCDVSLQTVGFGMKVGVNDAWSPYVKTERSSGGLLGALGVSEKRDVEAQLCSVPTVEGCCSTRTSSERRPRRYTFK